MTNTMEGYKFVDKDYKSRYGNMKYAVGETYIHEGPLVPCESGFHFGLTIADAIFWNSDARLLKVRGTECIEDYRNVVCRKLEILEEIELTLDIQKQLAGDSYFGVRQGLAENPNCLPELQKQLAGDPFWQVREGLAGNPNCLAELQKQLASDPDPDVRCSLAMNHNCLPELQKQLANDPDPVVRCSLVENHNCLPEVRELLEEG